MGPEPDLTDPTPGMHIWGWMTPVELRWLIRNAQTKESVVELGSLHGRSAYALAHACKGEVWCVDLWDDVNDASFGSFVGNVVTPFAHVTPIRQHSVDAANRFDPLSVEMVFIDASHTYESVLADICSWLPKCSWLICGHDYSNDPEPGYPGVKQAVDQVFGDRVTVEELTSIWAVDLRGDRTVGDGLPSGVVEWVDEYGKARSYDFAWA